MTLGGRIEVAGEPIGDWVAWNRGPVDPEALPNQLGPCRYEWRVACSHSFVTGELVHRRDAGAVALAAKVLTAAVEAGM